MQRGYPPLLFLYIGVPGELFRVFGGLSCWGLTCARQEA